jgi:phosphatidylserine synthase
MNWMPLLLLSANILTLLWAVKLLSRQPNRRLRHLVLTVSIVSVSQTVAFLCHLQGQSLLQAASALQQCVTSMGTMAAVYLLWVEIRDRNRIDQMLRLAEHENQLRRSRVDRSVREGARAIEQSR